MRAAAAAPIGALTLVALIAAVVSGLSAPGYAAPRPTDVPVTVIIPQLNPTPPPPKPTSTPSPSSSTGGGTPTPTPAPSNPDGSPIPPSKPTEDAGDLELDPEALPADEWMVATGSGFAPGEQVQFVLYPGPVIVGSYVADAAGHVWARFRIPADTRPGDAVVEATGWTSGYVANAPFTVVAIAGAGGLPVLWWVAIVLAALLAGLIATAIFFRNSIRGWFGGAAEAAGSTT